MSLANNLYIQAETSLNLKAFQKLQSLGNTGNVEAMYLLGLLYHSKSYYQDISQAAHWYFECAKRWNANKHAFNPSERLISLAEQQQPNADVLNNLGKCYEFGYAVAPDDSKAIKLYQQAAAIGNDVAMCNLGLAYKRGKGVELDPMKASFWFNQSCAKQTNHPTGSLLAAKQLAELMQPQADQLKETLKAIENKIESEEWMVKTFFNTWSRGMPTGIKQISILIKKTNWDDTQHLFAITKEILDILNDKIYKSPHRHYRTSQSYADFHMALSNIQNKVLKEYRL